MDYKDSGVNREQAAGAISDLKSKIESSYRPEILSAIGGFASAFEIPAGYKQPVILSTTDGVGTKLILAEEVNRPEVYKSIGQDLVAMCVNDLLAARGEPVAFLDYLATGKLETKKYEALIEGVVEACKTSGCSLIGGETAEMPGFYPTGRMDMAGFAVGVVEKDQLWDFSRIEEGDQVLAWPSSGFHSNGYSLIRKIMEKQNWTLSTELEGEVLGDALLKPTRLYVSDCLDHLRQAGAKAGIHVTGGGLYENAPRVLPDESPLGIRMEAKHLPENTLMQAFCEAGEVSRQESCSTFNMGVGFLMIASKSLAEKILSADSQVFHLGDVQRQEAPLFIEGL